MEIIGDCRYSFDTLQSYFSDVQSSKQLMLNFDQFVSCSYNDSCRFDSLCNIFSSLRALKHS